MNVATAAAVALMASAMGADAATLFTCPTSQGYTTGTEAGAAWEAEALPSYRIQLEQVGDGFDVILSGEGWERAASHYGGEVIGRELAEGRYLVTIDWGQAMETYLFVKSEAGGDVMWTQTNFGPVNGIGAYRGECE